MDLIGEFHPSSKRGHKYALTVICMLTGYVFCIPLRTKTASEVIQAYIDDVYAKFGVLIKYFQIMELSSKINFLNR